MTRHSAQNVSWFSAKRSPLAVVPAFIILIAFLVACGSASGNAVPNAAPPAPAVSAAAAGAPAPTTLQVASTSAGRASSTVLNKAAADAAAPTPPLTADTSVPYNRMVIRDAKLTLQVDDVEAALLKVREVADLNGGYVTASHTYLVKDGDKERMVADVTIAVRSETYDRAVQSIRQTALKVENEDGTSQDVTNQYVDLDANLRNLQASEDSLLKLIGKADKLDDVLTLQRELANVRGQIERLQGQMRLLENQTSMSTISVNLHLPPVTEPAPVVSGWSPVTTFERGWHASLLALESIADVIISVISFAWWLTPFAIAAFIIGRRASPRAPAA